MSRGFDSIKDITDAKEIWKFAVRLEDIWKMGSDRNEHLEFLILDKQGDNIQVCLPAELMDAWRPKLKEGSTDVMRNFRVKPNDFKVKLYDHPWMLTMVDGIGASVVTPHEFTDIPRYKLKFKPFKEIIAGHYHDDLLVDIIGVVHEIAAPRQNMGSKKYPTNFTLADSDMNILTCTLWDHYGTQFQAGYNAHGAASPFIVIIKHAKIKDPQGQYALTISNAWTGTKLLLDQELSEIREFRKTLPRDFLEQTQAQLDNGGGKLSSQNSQSSQFSTHVRYCYLAPATDLSKLPLLPEEQIVTTITTPHHVIIRNDGWFYYSCKTCNKKVITDSPPWKCKENHVTEDPLIKYKLELEVRHGNDKFKFLFCDRECTQLIGHAAPELRDIMIEAGEFDRHEYPLHLDNMIGKELAFKVKTQSKPIATVLTLKNEAEIIDHVKEQFSMENKIENLSKCPTHPSTIGESSKSNGQDANETTEETSIPTQDLSATGESSPDGVKMHTPAKRSGDIDSTPEPSSAKLSANKVLAKVKEEDVPSRKLKKQLR